MRYLLILLYGLLVFLFCWSSSECKAAPYHKLGRTSNFYNRSKQPCSRGCVTYPRTVIIKKSAPAKACPPRYYGFPATVSTGVRGRVVTPKPDPITIINPYFVPSKK